MGGRGASLADLDSLYFQGSPVELAKAVATLPRAYALSMSELYEQVISDVRDGKAGTIHPELYRAYSENLRNAVSGYDDDLKAQFEANLSRFAAYKAWHATRQLERQLADSDGVARSPEAFDRMARAVLNTFNRYQAAEYNTAVARARTAHQWQQFSQGDNMFLFPNLRWLPSRSANPREAHMPFYNRVWAKTDPFWQTNQPGNLWNCKCDWEETDDPVTGDNPEGIRPARGLEGNPAETGEIFTDKCTYIDRAGAKGEEAVREFMQTISPKKPVEEKSAQKDNSPLGKGKIKKDEDLTKAIAGLKTDWFKQGFKEILTENDKKNNGSTDGEGTIWLRPGVKKDCISALEKIRTGKECTEKEEKAIATLWHEITHNRHDLGKDSKGLGDFKDRDLKYMETANEFVARKTLPEFYQKVGGTMKYPEFMSDRDNTGYNDWVVKYQKVISDYKLDDAKVLETVRKGLFEGDYHKQKDNLINGLVEGGKTVDADGKVTYSLDREDARRTVNTLIL